MMKKLIPIAAAILDLHFDSTIGFSTSENHENDTQDEKLVPTSAAILDLHFDSTIGFNTNENQENDTHDEKIDIYCSRHLGFTFRQHYRL